MNKSHLPSGTPSPPVTPQDDGHDLQYSRQNAAKTPRTGGGKNAKRTVVGGGIAAIAMLLVYIGTLLPNFGFGTGGSDGEGDGTGTSVEINDSQETPEEPEGVLTGPAQVYVVGNGYYIEGRGSEQFTLDQIVEIAKNMNSGEQGYRVVINATLKAPLNAAGELEKRLSAPVKQNGAGLTRDIDFKTNKKVLVPEFIEAAR